MSNLIIRIVTLATFDCADRCVPGHSGCCGRGQRSGGRWRQTIAHEPARRFSAFVHRLRIPEAVGHQGHSRPKARKAKQSLFDDPAFAHGYRAAYSAIYDRTDYAAAIEQLKALGHDDHPNVANLIGYSYRKLGDYKLSQSGTSAP
jgi:hypothetical protein